MTTKHNPLAFSISSKIVFLVLSYANYVNFMIYWPHNFHTFFSLVIHTLLETILIQINQNLEHNSHWVTYPNNYCTQHLLLCDSFKYVGK